MQTNKRVETVRSSVIELLSGYTYKMSLIEDTEKESILKIRDIDQNGKLLESKELDTLAITFDVNLEVKFDGLYVESEVVDNDILVYISDF
jgi:hypothetical protein